MKAIRGRVLGRLVSEVKFVHSQAVTTVHGREGNTTTCCRISTGHFKFISKQGLSGRMAPKHSIQQYISYNKHKAVINQCFPQSATAANATDRFQKPPVSRQEVSVAEADTGTAEGRPTVSLEGITGHHTNTLLLCSCRGTCSFQMIYAQ